MKSIKCYELILVNIGRRTVDARPIAWNGKDYDGFGHDQNGKDIETITYITTCPRCAQLLTIMKDDLVLQGESFRLNFRNMDHLHEHNNKCPLAKEPQFANLDDIVVIIDEPVAVEPVAVEPVAVEPVAVEPVAVEPVAVLNVDDRLCGFVMDDKSVDILLGEEEGRDNVILIDPIDSGLLNVEVNTELQSLLDEENI